MSASQHQAIIAAIKAALEAAAPLAGINVFEGRNYQLPVGTPSQIQVYLEDSTPAQGPLRDSPIDWTTQITVLIKSRRSGTDAAEVVGDAVWVEAWAAVMADQTLGGLVDQFEPGPVTRDRDEADTDVHAITWQFTAMHRTSNNAIT